MPFGMIRHGPTPDLLADPEQFAGWVCWVVNGDEINMDGAMPVAVGNRANVTSGARGQTYAVDNVRHHAVFFGRNK